MLDRIMKGIDEMAEIGKGSVAVIVAEVLIAVSFVISAAVAGFSNVIDPSSFGL